MQGGGISPLLANVALHGMEKMLKEFAKTLDMRRNDNPNHQISWQKKVQSLTFVRYADDFVLIHKDLTVVQRCRELISEWLSDIGLELKPTKTRIAHTLFPELSEDGKAGIDFLGFHIQQFPVGRHNSAINPGNKLKLGFKTLITPSKDACKKHQLELKRVIKKHKYSHQARLINELNPIIRGWTNYYHFSDAQTTGELARQDYLLFQKLRAWARHRTDNWNKAKEKYWTKIGNNNWVFATRKGNANPFRLLSHTEFGSSSNEYVKVKGENSPFNGNLVYWSTRMGKHPEMPTRKASLLKRQKGICPWCCLHFREGDILEVDHILATTLGGKDEYRNLQLLHGHCHDEKTALDMEHIRKRQTTKRLKITNQELNKIVWYWKEDILIISNQKVGCSTDKDKYIE